MRVIHNNACKNTTKQAQPPLTDSILLVCSDNFRRGMSKVLLATNVLSRGIDTLQVSLVINYDLPMRLLPQQRSFTVDPETYLHRIGRPFRSWPPQVINHYAT